MPGQPQGRTPGDARERLLSTPITKEVQLLVEGGDDVAFVSAVLAGQPRQAARVQVHACGGKQSIRSMLDALATLLPDTPARKIVVLRDADDDAATAERECFSYFRQAGYPCPGQAVDDWPEVSANLAGLATGWLLVPGQGQPGTLETLILAALAQDACMDLATGMLTACLGARDKNPAWPGKRAKKHAVTGVAAAEKAKVQAFLAGFARKGYRLPSSAFEEGVLSPDHAAFDGIRQQLLGL